MKKIHLFSYLLFFGVITLSSCVQGDMFDELYDAGDLNSVICRKKGAKDTSYSSDYDSNCQSNDYTNYPGYNYFFISKNLQYQTTCAVEAVCFITGWNTRQINKKFQEIEEERHGKDKKRDRKKRSYDVEDIPTIFEVMGGYTCEEITDPTLLRKGDIAITNSPLELVAINEYGSLVKIDCSGHAFVIDEVIATGNSYWYRDDDATYYCTFDKSYIQGGYRITENE